MGSRTNATHNIGLLSFQKVIAIGMWMRKKKTTSIAMIINAAIFLD